MGARLIRLAVFGELMGESMAMIPDRI